jgi:hypothetical protein
MGPWVIIFLGGTNNTNVVIYGSYPDEATATAAAISTGAPWNYQVCECWGPAIPPPMGMLTPVTVPENAWLAIASAISQNGGVRPVGYYGTGWDENAAQAWAAKQNNPAGFSFGQVTKLPGT